MDKRTLKDKIQSYLDHGWKLEAVTMLLQDKYNISHVCMVTIVKELGYEQES